MCAVMVLCRQTKLLKMAHTLSAPRRLTRCLYSRQQQRDQDANDGDHDQQFDQRKTMFD